MADVIAQDEQDVNEYEQLFDSDINDFERGILFATGALTVDSSIADANFIVQASLAESGYTDTLNDMINNKYNDILDEETERIERITKSAVVVSDETLETLMKQKAVDLQNFGSVTQNIQNKISNELYQFSQGTLTERQLRERLTGITEQYKGWTNTWTNTAITGFKQQSSNLIATENGLTKFKYAGKIKLNTRQFCRNVLNKVFGSIVKTLDEWNKLNDVPSRKGQPDPVSVHRGGFNCVHRLIPVG